MGRYLEILKQPKASGQCSRWSPQTQAVGAVPVTCNSAVRSDLDSNRPSLTTTPTKDRESAHSSASIQATPDSTSVPNGYCPECGGGYWIRQTWESPYVCGRCLPVAHVESVYVSGGTPRRIPPIKAGWVVTYRDQAGRLCGGADDRAHGTVKECRWDARDWMVCLTDGRQVPLSHIRAVGQTDEEGRICSAWTVREHGYDGEGSKT